MSLKRVFNSDELEDLMKQQPRRKVVEGSRLSRKKRTLESDEEDDDVAEEEQNILNPEEFAGEEEPTIEHDGEIQITPFNMREELKEGRFDSEGCFIFNKDIDEIKDQWLDDIDWVKVKYSEAKRKMQNVENSDSEDLPELDVIGHYKKMLDIMKPQETVQKTIRRLGGSTSTSNKWKKKKEEMESVDPEDKDKLLELTGLASDIIQSGNMDIYEQTYERLSFLVKDSEKPKDETFKTNDGLDMFSDDFEVKEKTTEDSKLSKEQSEATETPLDNEVKWEFKWEQKDDAPIYGPHATTEMLRWVQEGYFEDGVYVRQVGRQDGQFYSSKRTDFELYL